MEILRRVHSRLLHFLYPAFCLHCDAGLARGNPFLCTSCFSLITWMEHRSFCALCALPLAEKRGKRCRACQRRPLYLQPHHSLFSPFGPIVDLLAFLRTRLSSQLAKLFASFFILFLNRVVWPLPEVIIPIPDSRIATWSRKRQAVVWIAREVGRFLELPLLSPFSHDERLELKRGARPLPGKRVLLLVVEIEDGELIQRARRLLKKLFVQEIYSLALVEKRESSLEAHR